MAENTKKKRFYDANGKSYAGYGNKKRFSAAGGDNDGGKKTGYKPERPYRENRTKPEENADTESLNGGEDIIIGRNPVMEALRSGTREIDTIFILNIPEEGHNPLGRILGMAKEKHIPVRRVPKAKLDEMASPFASGNTPANHQGICARAAMVKYAEVDDIFALAESKGERPFIIALDGITDPHNLGAIVRSAEVFGAHGVIIPRNRSASMNAAAMKAASGAGEYIPIAKVGNLGQTIDELKSKNVFIAGADMNGDPAYKADLTGAICLVIGSEGEGISKLVREKCDFMVRIDVMGKVDSLNASCAAAVLMYEKLRQMSV